MTDKEFVIDSFCAWDGDALVLNILGKPGSNRDVIGKVKGKQRKVSVTASPMAGRATDHNGPVGRAYLPGFSAFAARMNSSAIIAAESFNIWLMSSPFDDRLLPERCE